MLHEILSPAEVLGLYNLIGMFAAVLMILDEHRDSFIARRDGVQRV